ncbi:MAG: glycosyltransferase family 2 protein [Planctomycetaceae bacterium]|nr:glycosyltransferase family 2 protein [Planctomycetaceae bacterium]MCA9108615.1 glycosyltransferase family 2 protein [Planctomycetaceae bacterium]
MNEPLVSIIIPCYNAAEFVGEAIESALGQTYGNIEVIVIDDGSTDESVEVLRSFGNRIRWETGPNHGACATRNRGLQISKGQIIQFHDSDDLLHTSKLQVQVPLLMGREKTTIFCDVETTLMDSGKTLEVNQPSETDGFRQVCLHKITTPAPIHWKHDLQLVGGFRSHLRCAQEKDLHLRMACSGIEFEHHSGVFVTVRRRLESLSSSYERVLDQLTEVYETAYQLLVENEQQTDARCQAIAEALSAFAKHNAARGRTVEAERCQSLAGRIHSSRGYQAHTMLRRFAYQLVGYRLVHQLDAMRYRRRMTAQGAS